MALDMAPDLSMILDTATAPDMATPVHLGSTITAPDGTDLDADPYWNRLVGFFGSSLFHVGNPSSLGTVLKSSLPAMR